MTAGFPTQPARFWGDTDGEKYFKSYFERFDNVSSFRWQNFCLLEEYPLTPLSLLA